jgi:hypothetical protein
MRRISLFLAVLVDSTARGQDFPNPSAAEKATLETWIGRLLASGGLARPRGP